MKLIYLTSRFPYPINKGDKLRSYHQIKELSKPLVKLWKSCYQTFEKGLTTPRIFEKTEKQKTENKDK